MGHGNRSARDLFHAAGRAYQEGHQACIACRRPHCVFISTWEGTREYRCFECGFAIARQATRGYLISQEPADTIDPLTDEAPPLLDDLAAHPALRPLGR